MYLCVLSAWYQGDRLNGSPPPQKKDRTPGTCDGDLVWKGRGFFADLIGLGFLDETILDYLGGP